MLAYLKTVLAQNNYKLFTRPYELNIVGIRNKSSVSNRFDDTLHVFFRTDNSFNSWQHKIYPITTDPGTYWLTNPTIEKGTAILAAGQYRDAYQIGLHRGKYEALVQRGEVTVLRDYDRDAVLDFFNGTSYRGLFGINIHRASLQGTTKTIDRHSAGCQVFANADDFAQFMQLCRKQRNLYGNKFTYTLLDHRAQIRSRRLIAVTGISLLVAAGIVAIGLSQDETPTHQKKAERAIKIPRSYPAFPPYDYMEEAY